ncbi:MAG TPA: arsenate reductase (glutaredoxin) [Telluria sp.]|nr:arsenate reductase (glutaredoxin) [Telluria sp.]
MTTTIYHNPRCSNSRGALELIRAAGIEPQVIDYLEHPPTREKLRELIERAGLSVRDAIRSKEPQYAELGLDHATDEQLLDAMVAHPVLINRPFVATEKGVRLARPPGLVREILP